MSDSWGAQEVLAAAVAAAGDVAYVWDIAADRIAWAGDTAALFGPGLPSVLSGDALRGRIAPADRDRHGQALRRHFDDGGAFDCDYRLRLIDGAHHWVHDRGQVERATDGAPVRMCGLLRLIDRRKAYEATLEHRAHFDPLTGLMNRQRLREALENTQAGPAGVAVPAVYLAVGIDRLGLVNDTLGHATADAAVVEVARRLATAVRPGDSVGRAGGDVFGVVLPRCPEAGMARVADKLLTAVRSAPVATPMGPVHVTVSVGGTLVEGDAEAAMTRAETALIEAKRQGRDGFWPHHLTSPRQTALRNSVATGQRVKAALRDGATRFAFQPVVDGTGRVAFYECLLRITDGGTGEPLPAGAFMPAVERLCMARRLDHHTLDMALAELRSHGEVRLALNLSAGTTADTSWLAALESGLAGRPDLADRLIVEITESAAIEDVDETAGFVAAVRRLGCRVALDDFGAGYLSYRHLRALPVDIVKIDGSFVQELADGGSATLFVRTMVGLAKALGLTTVAEGVERPAQADALRREGVDLLQGFHFGRPRLVRPWLEEGAQRSATVVEAMARARL
ncbi:putative bifunctional diguanylate cyclase/phosphodiesterase [Azospirillum sp. A39]|uniref:putative bifunctional diguanylate cyclase/phosphodiesterase n=1 Tax=Azospirillum sp. A39 TaxID=3462279 RepID=UPI004045A10A